MSQLSIYFFLTLFTTTLHLSLSFALIFHSYTPTFLTSFTTASSHFVFGHQLFFLSTPPYLQHLLRRSIHRDPTDVSKSPHSLGSYASYSWACKNPLYLISSASPSTIFHLSLKFFVAPVSFIF